MDYCNGKLNLNLQVRKMKVGRIWNGEPQRLSRGIEVGRWG